MPDLKTTDDITKFMEHFYGQLLSNPITAPVFEEIDMQLHMPKVVAFWERIAFGTGQYSGSPFEPHVPLDLKADHFNIWFETFCSCLDDHFEGATASMVKERARSIAFIFSHKLGLPEPNI
jgi:hemoglobin